MPCAKPIADGRLALGQAVQIAHIAERFSKREGSKTALYCTYVVGLSVGLIARDGTKLLKIT